MKESLYSKIGEYNDMKRFSQYFKPVNVLGGISGSSNTLMTCFEKWSSDPNVTYLDLARILKNYLYYLTVVIPSGIVNAKTMSHNNPNSWVFNPSDTEKILNMVNEKYEGLNSYSEDHVIKQLVQTLQPCWKTIYNTVSLTHGCFPEEMDTLYKDYLLFCLYYVFYRLVYVEDEIAELIIQENDNQSEFETIEFVDKDTIVYRSIGFLRFLLDLDSSNRNSFVRGIQKSVVHYSSIQANIDKIRSKEKEEIQKNFRTNNKKILAAEKALKKLKMGNYYTDLNLLKKYGKRDKFTKDTNYLANDDATAANNINTMILDGDDQEETNNEMNTLWNNDTNAIDHIYENNVATGVNDEDYDDDMFNDDEQNMDYDDLYDAGDNDCWDMLEKDTD